ncbi:glycosyltransferase family 2 protein [Thermosynechococcus vestitus]|uniref:glycosyltransferase family 2 protein n=1 Tax=Thermosynechococcus vestitus TaxID=146786 RepID=UPI00031BF36F|nr:glycosyltransferase [Thermosynechococcus vestitus]
MTCNHQSNRPLLSVLMPVFNAEAYVGEAIESILGQSFRDFEFIIIDDGSTDNSLSVLKRYAVQDARIRLISRENRGLVATLNEGIALARGEWIARMDADDVAMPNRFIVQLAALERERVDFCGGAIQCFGALRSVCFYPLTHEACEVHLLFGVPFGHPTVIGRHSAFAELGYDPDYPYAEDYELWQRAWGRGYKFVNVPEVVLRYRVHAGQVSARKKAEQQNTADAVRKRHWRALFPRMDDKEIDYIIKMLHDGKGETSRLLPCLLSLVSHYSGEARQVLLLDSYGAFRELAGSDRSAWRNWLTLKKQACSDAVEVKDVFRTAVLWGFSIFNITKGSIRYQLLQKIKSIVLK